MTGVSRIVAAKLQNLPRKLKKVLAMIRWEKLPCRVMCSSLSEEGSVMTFNGEIRNPLAPWLQDRAPIGLSVLCRSNEFTIAEEEVITDSPVIVLIESGPNLPCSAPLFPFHQPLIEGVGCSHQHPVKNVEPL